MHGLTSSCLPSSPIGRRHAWWCASAPVLSPCCAARTSARPAGPLPAPGHQRISRSPTTRDGRHPGQGPAGQRVASGAVRLCSKASRSRVSADVRRSGCGSNPRCARTFSITERFGSGRSNSRVPGASLLQPVNFLGAGRSGRMSGTGRGQSRQCSDGCLSPKAAMGKSNCDCLVADQEPSPGASCNRAKGSFA